MVDAMQAFGQLVEATKEALAELERPLSREQIKASAEQVVEQVSTDYLAAAIAGDLHRGWLRHIRLTDPELYSISPGDAHRAVVVAQIVRYILANEEWRKANAVFPESETPLMDELAQKLEHIYRPGGQTSLVELINKYVPRSFEFRKYIGELPWCDHLLENVPELKGARPELLELMPVDLLLSWIRQELMARLQHFESQSP